MPEGLPWPPREEDLRRLYVDQRLSAMRIAEAYGLRYASPKTAESTILYHLKRNGIARRDPSEHIRKVTPEMADEWARRYAAGESLKQIAEDEVGAVTVWNHLKRRGVTLRDKVEAQIKAVSKYQRLPFAGSQVDKAYLMGLRFGDLNVVRHGRVVRVRVSTTHPAMANLFRTLFESSGHVQSYPRHSRLVEYEWSLECDLDASYEFLIARPDPVILEDIPKKEFYGFLAGLFDAEGSVLFHLKTSRYSPELSITNTDGKMLVAIMNRLERDGFHPHIARKTQKEGRYPSAQAGLIWRLSIWRIADALNLLSALDLRHSEKVAKKKLALRLVSLDQSTLNSKVRTEWDILCERIKQDTAAFVTLARVELAKRKTSKLGMPAE